MFISINVVLAAVLVVAPLVFCNLKVFEILKELRAAQETLCTYGTTKDTSKKVLNNTLSPRKQQATAKLQRWDDNLDA